MMRRLAQTMIVSFALTACAWGFGADPPDAAGSGEQPEQRGMSISQAKPETPKRAEADLKGPSAKSFGYAVIGVADLDQALGLWVRRFGMEIASHRRGGDPGLSAVWGLEADAIADQALLTTPGLIDGGLHLVEFAKPRAPERQGDGLRSVHVAVRDILERQREIEAAGLRLRSPVGRIKVDGRTIDAARLTVDDVLSIVLFERSDAQWPASRRGYSVTPHVSLVVADLKSEVTFFEQALGLQVLDQYRLAGEAAERTLGVPAGGAADARLLGGPVSRFGRIELVQYEGVSGAAVYNRISPPELGLLSVTYVVPDLTPILERGAAFGIREHGRVRSILGEGRMISMTSPAGLRVDIIEQ